MRRYDLSPALVARWLVFASLALVPMRIAASGYLPDDDALRHAAKAVSDRPWSEVLVLRPDVTMDSHPGWHALLRVAHRIADATAPDLVVLSVVGLMLLFLLPPVLVMRRPEAWALALAGFATLQPRVFNRLASGRPFLFSATLLVVLCLLRLSGERATPVRAILLLSPVFGLVAWMNPSWHLFLLPIAGAALAGERRLAGVLAASLAGGVAVAGALHGNPLEFVDQSVRHTILAMGTRAPPGTLVMELQPGDGSPLVVLGVLALLIWRQARGQWHPATVSNSVFVLAGGAWVLGFVVRRFWTDWGAIALLAWMAHELQLALEDWLPEDARRRVGVAVVCGLTALVACTAGLHGIPAVERPYAALTAAAAEPALPDAGGILYTDDMRAFYQVFYSRPRAPFRYIVGYEPALMPPDDLVTFHRTLQARTADSFLPWIAKMRPEDRLIIRSTEGEPPIPGLHWSQVSQTVWSGRVARAAGQ